MYKFLCLILIASAPLFSQAANPWQQHVDYQMEVQMDVNSNQFTGTQTLVYTNNSPDELDQVFYHLYFNAFQPGSMMDVRNLNLRDSDSRVKDRISKLKDDEIGFLKATALSQDGKAVEYMHKGSILQVKLASPIPPGGKTTLKMDFNGQVPLQIRRSGRDNREGIRLSMSQWYPKLAEYDHMGWHANPYIGREFHGVWGDFDVKLTLDASYTVAATGILQNKKEIGHGYTEAPVDVSGKENLTWHFKAENVHDFVWAADPNYKHVIYTEEGAPELHFFYVEDSATANWSELPAYTAKAFKIMARDVGKYPFAKYSVIQGGDGGMEYPMATLITGHRRLGSLVGVTVHELIHSWFQGVLATNESLYPWMDEGFTSYYSSRVVSELFERGDDPEMFAGSYQGYFALIEAGMQEPMTTHADHYNTNFAYGVNAYSKGTVLVHQLSYVIGQDAVERGMKAYFQKYKFRHPNEVDFRREMEKASGLELDWYFEYFVNSIHTVDYKIDEVKKGNGGTQVTLKRLGTMPMPVEVLVTLKDGSKERHYVPLRIMWGEKQAEGEGNWVAHEAWPWTNPTYTVDLPIKMKKIARMEIDPSRRMADTKRKNNIWKDE